MDTFVLVILMLIVAALSGAVGWWAASLRATQTTLLKRIADLEELQPKRHVHKNAVTIENILAHAIRAKRDVAEAQAASDTLLEILKAWRADPNYRSEQD